MLINPKTPLSVTCDATDSDAEIDISWVLSENRCWDSEGSERLNASTQVHSIKRPPYACKHDGHIILDEFKFSNSAPEEKKESDSSGGGLRQAPEHPIVTIHKDGMYNFQLAIQSQRPFLAKVHIEMKAPYGYLSATDWPLLLVGKNKLKHKPTYYDCRPL